MKNEKAFGDVLNQLFSIWEEFIIDGLDDYHYNSGRFEQNYEAPLVQNALVFLLCVSVDKRITILQLPMSYL